MRWEVGEESPHRNSQGVEDGQWFTQINLDLPNLGGVSARLSFNGNALKLALDVTDAQTRDKLGSASSQLIAALSGRGISVSQTQITQNEHTG
jgi:flagellar hook-length control protein FliK